MVPLERLRMIAFIAAERREFRGFQRHLENIKKLSWPIDYAVSASLNGIPVVLAANGPGPQLVKKVGRELKAGAYDMFVSIGFCGALSDRLKPGAVFIATSVNGRVIDAPRKSPAAARGPLLSIRDVVTTAEEKKKLRKTGAEVVEMEAGEVCCQARGVARFSCVRVVTDTSVESFPLDFNQMRDEAGRFSRIRIAAEAVRHPFKLIPELVRLDRRCREAAVALGDFIANCQF